MSKDKQAADEGHHGGDHHHALHAPRLRRQDLQERFDDCDLMEQLLRGIYVHSREIVEASDDYDPKAAGAWDLLLGLGHAKRDPASRSSSCKSCSIS